jgi:hypothetical protein
MLLSNNAKHKSYKLPRELDDANIKMSQAIEVEKPKRKEIHMTTIAGEQAAAILKAINSGHVNSWCDKSVEGLPLVELWVEVIPGEYDYNKW